ncbi:MAG: ATP-binding cassette domain-containing protein [Leptospiraceae bacterium]|nr:ATP-binding cassette domain-containing protein [Leptospiraceae bacterium]MCP5513273.1 ATP-binding cassette domain-containing protein [Leptospiraceae bacterium]
MKNDPAILVRNLSISIHGNSILKNLSVSIEKFKITCIVGESGSGKSTFFKYLLGLREGMQVEGSAFIFGEELIVPSDKIQIVFQDPFLYFNPNWNLEKSLLEPVFLQKKDPEKLKPILLKNLEMFSLDPNSIHKKPDEFSGGELQRLSIVRALMTEPEILLMDEPVSGLDRLVLEDTIAFIHRLQKQNPMTLVIITHDLEFAGGVSDSVIVLNRGEIIEFGRSTEVFSNPQNETTKGLLKARNLSGIRWKEG